MNNRLLQFSWLPLGVRILIAAMLIGGVENLSAEIDQQNKPDSSSQSAKAYRSLDFGDNLEVVKRKLAEILVDARISTSSYYDNEHSGSFWRALFETDADYEPFKPSENLLAETSERRRSLIGYFRKKLYVVSGQNELISAKCFLIGDEIEKASLAVVEVNYLNLGTDGLTNGFLQRFPKARNENKHYKVEFLPFYPSVFVEYDKTILEANDDEQRASLSVSIGQARCSFAQSCKLSDSEKDSLAQKIAGTKPDVPQAVFVSKKMISPIMRDYIQASLQEGQDATSKLMKLKESATKF